MRSSWTTRLAVPLLAGAIMGCSDTGGPGNATDLIIDFCSGSDTPVFIAFQNEGQSWTRLTPDGNGTIAFRASNKVGLALVYQTGGSAFFTDILYTTREELEPLANNTCGEQLGTKTLNGSVASVSGTASADVTMGADYVQVTPPPSTFTLGGLVSGPLDLIASRSDFVLGVYSPNRVIVRRGVNLTSQATIPALDFAATEALVPATGIASIAGFASGDNTSLFVDFSTATTPYHPLYQRIGVPSASQPIFGIPSSLTQSGDVHILTVRALSNSGNSYRVVEQYYQVPGDRTVSLGAALSAPSVTTLSSTPYLRLGTTLPAQSDYPSFANVTHTQTSRIVSVTGTEAYFGGTPGSWVLDIPDLSTVSGFSQSFALQSGVSTQSYAEAYGGTLAAFFGAFADNESLRFAGRLSGAALAQMYGADAGRNTRRSRFSAGRASVRR